MKHSFCPWICYHCVECFRLKSFQGGEVAYNHNWISGCILEHIILIFFFVKEAICNKTNLDIAAGNIFQIDIRPLFVILGLIPSHRILAVLQNPLLFMCHCASCEKTSLKYSYLGGDSIQWRSTD